MTLSEVFNHIEANHPKALEDLAGLCRIPSVSAQGRALGDAASATRKLLESIGSPAEEYSTGEGPPVVFGEIRADQALPTLLMYNHYDVQPEEPIDEWRSDPFDPVVRDGMFFARGSADTKGNIAAQVAAARAFLAVEGNVPVNLKFVVEGAEESSAASFTRFVREHGHLLAADGATIEGGYHNEEGLPQIALGCKGDYYVELRCRTARIDQHSSVAAALPNPAWRLVECLRTLRSPSGRILIDGWYDNAPKPTPEELSWLRRSSFRAQRLKDVYGAQWLYGGEGDLAVLKRLIYSPTCTISGFVSGYTGEGCKTVNPAEARVKLDFRLLPGMMSEEADAKLRAHLKRGGFDDIEVTVFEPLEPSAIPLDSPIAHATIQAAVDVYPQPPDVRPWSPGSSTHYFFNKVVGVPSVSGPGVGYDGSAVHAPNEHIRIRDFINGAKHFAALMARMAGNPAVGGGP
jgi:acetylornithine deacetylase/succinyl-diaminopimelate desuccinylase-like protein